MATLMKLVKVVIGAAILNKILKVGLVADLMRLINRSAGLSMKGSNKSSYLGILLDLALALLLSRSKKGSWFTQTTAVPTIGVLLTTFMRSIEKYCGPKDQTIEIDDYTIIDER